MQRSSAPKTPKTTTDIVFARLQDEILSLELLPGTRMSEAEVASRLGVSRQPVRDAFNRLGNLGLLLIRPQRATEVRGFSMQEIQNSRFVRLAVELEVVSYGCAVWDETRARTLERNIEQQRTAIETGLTDRFHALDYDFHRLICDLSGHPLAYETIERCKRAVDRLCVLSLGRVDEVTAILDDHLHIARALHSGAVEQARATMRHHLKRLDETLTDIHMEHADYFE